MSFGIPELLIILGVCLCSLVIIAAIVIVVVLIVRKNRKQTEPVSQTAEEV